MVRQPIFGVLEVLGRAAFFRWLPFCWRSGARLSAGVVGCAARDQSLGSSDTATGIFGRVRVLAGFGCFILHTFAGVSMHGTMREHIHVRLGGF